MTLECDMDIGARIFTSSLKEAAENLSARFSDI